jgi:hypothetical protein
MVIPVVPLKREVVEIPLGKHETLWPPKLVQVRVEGEPHKSTGPAFTPGIVRGGDELAKRQWFLPAIRFHRLKYKPGDRATAMGCSPHL